MRRLRRGSAPAVDLNPGERVLAWAEASDGRTVAGSHDALHVVDGAHRDRLPWEQVEAAAWDSATRTLTVSEVGSWGERRREHVVELPEPGRLVELLRERVTASIVLQRHVDLGSRRGMRVIARRAPRGTAEVTWVFEYDEGVDPADPGVAEAAEAALAQARRDVGLD